MIPVILYALFLFVVLFCAGSISKRFLYWIARAGKESDSRGALEEDTAAVLFLGMVLVTSLVSVVSLFHPIDLKVHVAVSALMIVLGGRDLWHLINGSLRLRFSRNWPLSVAALACLISLTLAATDRTSHYDTGLYHAQMVQWNHEFGVVPGLANLHGRLGFNSTWDVFAAFVDQHYFRGLSFHVVGLIVGAILLLSSVEGFRRLLGGSRSLSTYLRCLGIVVVLYDYRLLVPSLSTDWPSRLLLYYLAILTVEHLEMSAAAKNVNVGVRLANMGLLSALAMFALTIKLSNGPIILLLVLLWLTTELKSRATILLLVTAFSVLVPFAIRNIILTGYLIYPFAGVDIFNLDWKVPRTDVESMASIIKYWAINPVDGWYRAREMDLSGQAQTWLKWRGEEMSSVFGWFCLGLFLWVIASLWSKARLRRDFLWNCAICAVLLTGILFWLFQAPEPRFVVGWFLALGLFSVAWLSHVLTDSTIWKTEYSKVAGYILLFGCTLWIIRHAGMKRILQEKSASFWSLSSLPAIETMELRSERGALVRIPVKDDRAWGTPVPTTTPLGFNPWLEMRGRNLRDGFRVTKAGFGIGSVKREELVLTPPGTRFAP